MILLAADIKQVNFLRQELARGVRCSARMKTKSLKLTAFAALLLSSLFLSSGCRTMEGAGEDIENAGESIQDAAK